MQRRHLIFAAMAAASFILAPIAHADDWSATPITVHEWGVEVFDWANPTPKSPLLPNFIHTDKNPGLPQPATTQPVKYLPPDNGARFKPVLHFYLPEHSMGEAIVGVELRFAHGHANAWYPQASLYRTPDMTSNALAPDLDAWKKTPAGSFALGRAPEDPRMELTWNRLTLTNELPAAVKLEEVPQKHWIDTAREVKSAYISNGSEAERFLFYEGAIHETPAIAIIPDLPAQPIRSFASHIVNVSSRPIHNVFAIYHRNGHTWLGYASTLDPFEVPAANLPRVAGGGGAGFTIPTISLPDFDTFTDWTDEKTFHALTTDRFVSALSENGAMVIDRGFRNPSFPQGPTMAGNLFPEEAAAVEKIWHDDFFNSEGLTVVYRESPAALDEAMPLNLYTDMYHYIQLSRCGLVVNKNINIQGTMPFNTTPAALEKLDPAALAKAIAQMKANHMYLDVSIAFNERAGRTDEVTRLRQLQQLIEKP